MSIIERKTVDIFLNHTPVNNMDFTESVIVDLMDMVEKFRELVNNGFKLEGQPIVQKDAGMILLCYKFTSLDSKYGELKEEFISFQRSYFERVQLTVAPSSEILNKSIEDNTLNWSVRTYNCLKNINVQTLGDLTQKTEKELLESKNFGRKSLNEIKEILANIGLSLKQYSS